MRKVSSDSVIDEGFQQLGFTSSGKNFKVAESQKGGRYPADDGTRLFFWVAVIEHIANYPLAGRYQAERTGGWNAEVVHGLAA